MSSTNLTGKSGSTNTKDNHQLVVAYPTRLVISTCVLYYSVFFEQCDAIFLNYTWTTENLLNSAKNSHGRLHDVYVGLDVFGRGMIGGGGFNTKEVSA